MKKSIGRSICVLLCLFTLASALSGCGGGGGQKAVSLSDGWYAAPADTLDEETAVKGFAEGEALTLSQACMENGAGGGCYYSNAFRCSLDAGRGDRVLLRLHDTCGGEKLWLNGRELTPDPVIDVTKQIKKSGSNTLVMRCSGELVSPGSKVTVEVRPEVMVEGVSTGLDMESGKISLHVGVRNMGDAQAEKTLSVVLTSMDNNAPAAERTQAVSIPAGSSVQSIELDMPDVIEWGYKNPYIYKVSVTLDGDGYSDYVGFKSVSVDGDGFYSVNGERTFIKCAEITLADALGGVRDILNYIKTSGFNAVCVADGAPTEAMLDYCDRLGLLAFQDSAAVQDDHISAVGFDGAASFQASGGADSAALRGIEDGGLVRLSLAYGSDARAEGESLVRWYESAGAGADFAAAEAESLADTAEVGDMAALITAARESDVAGVIVAMDMTYVKTSFADVMPDSLNDLRFTVSADRTNLYTTDSLRLRVGISNFEVLDPKPYSVKISIVGEQGLAYTKTVEADLSGGHVTAVLDESIPLAGYAPGRYQVACELVYGGHPTCGEMYFHVSDRAALPRISATVYAAGLSEHQKTLLSEQGAAVADYTGAESGTVILGAGCTDQTLLEKASSAKNLILLAPQNFGFAGLPVEASEAPMPAVFAAAGEYTAGSAAAGGYLTGAEFGDIFTGAAFYASPQVPVVSGLSVSADGSTATALVCGVFETDGGTVSLCTLNTERANPFTDALLLRLASN